jgi:hypothetical protein
MESEKKNWKIIIEIKTTANMGTDPETGTDFGLKYYAMVHMPTRPHGVGCLHASVKD